MKAGEAGVEPANTKQRVAPTRPPIAMTGSFALIEPEVTPVAYFSYLQVLGYFGVAGSPCGIFGQRTDFYRHTLHTCPQKISIWRWKAECLFRIGSTYSRKAKARSEEALGGRPVRRPLRLCWGPSGKDRLGR